MQAQQAEAAARIDGDEARNARRAAVKLRQVGKFERRRANIVRREGKLLRMHAGEHGDAALLQVVGKPDGRFALAQQDRAVRPFRRQKMRGLFLLAQDAPAVRLPG